MPTPSEFAESIEEAARTINKPQRLDDTLQTIVEVACNSVPGFDHVGIATVERKGKIETRAFTGDLVMSLDKVQYDLREGPCSVSLQGTELMSVAILKNEQRWPRYVPQARAAGVQSQMSVRLYLDEGAVGGINFYSTISDEISNDTRAFARLFATHAAIALSHARERENFTEGLRTRRATGQAIGILMERYQINEDRAFAFLIRASSHGNIKLRDIAQELVDQTNGR